MGEEKIGMEQNENTVEVADASNDNIQNVDDNNITENQVVADYEANTDVAVKSKKNKGCCSSLNNSCYTNISVGGRIFGI